jgi:hypothetical protein
MRQIKRVAGSVMNTVRSGRKTISLMQNYTDIS